jgi:hypothetical protein
VQVEVKLRLPDAAAHAKVASLLSGSQQAVHAQENYFFDGSQQELGQQRVVLRLRFYNKDKKAVVTLKVCEGRQAGRKERFAWCCCSWPGGQHELLLRLYCAVLAPSRIIRPVAAVPTRGSRMPAPAMLAAPVSFSAIWVPPTPPIQGKQILVDGIGRASEVEAPVDAVAARAYLQQPDGLLGLDIAPIKALKQL